MLSVSVEDKATLERYARGRTVSQALALRARIVLRCATGDRQCAIAEGLGITDDTVRKWERRFAARGVAGLSDVPKPNVHRKAPAAIEATDGNWTAGRRVDLS